MHVWCRKHANRSRGVYTFREHDSNGSKMGGQRILSPCSVWSLPELLNAFRQHSIKERHVYSIWRCGHQLSCMQQQQQLPKSAATAATAAVPAANSALLRNPDIPWSDIPNLPKAASTLLDEQFTRCTSKVLRVQEAASADTTKLLIELQDGLQVEAVVMHYDTTGACVMMIAKAANASKHHPHHPQVSGLHVVCVWCCCRALHGAAGRGRLGQQAWQPLCVVASGVPDGLHLLRDR